MKTILAVNFRQDFQNILWLKADYLLPEAIPDAQIY